LQIASYVTPQTPAHLSGEILHPQRWGYCSVHRNAAAFVVAIGAGVVSRAAHTAIFIDRAIPSEDNKDLTFEVHLDLVLEKSKV
jgi:hypothetical protein